MRQDTNKVAVRYASSLLQVSEAQKVTDKVLTELSALVDIFRAHADLTKIMGSPVVCAREKRAVLLDIGQKQKVSDVSQNFIKTLCDAGRADIFCDVVDTLKQEIDVAHGVYEARITSCVELSAERKKELEALLQKTMQGSMRFTYHVDGDVMGGFIVDMDGVMYDASLQTELVKLKQIMKG